MARPRRFLAVATLLVGAFSYGACSRAPPAAQPGYDTARARRTLVTALESWRDGKARLLMKQNPPIRFVDDQHSTGWRLTSFQLADGAAPVSPFDNLSVRLALKDRNGREVRQTAAYQIGLQPSLTVLRGEL